MTYTVFKGEAGKQKLFECFDAMTLMDLLGVRKEAVDRVHREKDCVVHGNGKYFLDRYTSVRVVCS